MFSISKALKSFKFAVRGLLIFFRNENNAKVHLFASAVVIFLSAYFNISKNEWLWILLAIALVWCAEAFNTAIEKLVDFVSPGFHPKAGQIKDLAAAGVFIMAILSVAIAIVVFKDYFLELFSK